MMQMPAHQPLLNLTTHINLVTDVDWNQVQRSEVQNSNASTSGWHLLHIVAADWDTLLITRH